MKECLGLYIAKHQSLNLKFIAAWDKRDKLLILFCNKDNIPEAHVIDSKGAYVVPHWDMRGFDSRASQSFEILTQYAIQMRFDIRSYTNGEYGIQVSGSLLGGGFWTAAIGLVTTAASVASMVATLGVSAPVSAAGLGAGITMIRRGFTTEDELSWDLVADVGANAVAGAATAGMGSYLAAAKTAKAGIDATKTTVTLMQAVGRGAASGAVGSVAGTAAKAVVTWEMPSGEDLATSLLTGVFSGGVGGGISGIPVETGTKVAKTLVKSVIEKNIQKALDLGIPPDEIYKVLKPILTPENFKTAVDVTQVALRASAGAAAGGAVAGATKVATNLATGKRADEGVLEAATIGVTIGSITAMQGHGGKAVPVAPVSEDVAEGMTKVGAVATTAAGGAGSSSTQREAPVGAASPTTAGTTPFTDSRSESSASAPLKDPSTFTSATPTDGTAATNGTTLPSGSEDSGFHTNSAVKKDSSASAGAAGGAGSSSAQREAPVGAASPATAGTTPFADSGSESGTSTPCSVEDMVMVRVWKMDLSKKRVGHVSLETTGEGGRYASYWPAGAGDGKGVTGISDCLKVPGTFSPSLAEDIKREGCFPDQQLFLRSLDVNKINEALHNFIQKNNKYWSIAGSGFFAGKDTKNCAGLVLHLLQEGGLNITTGKIDMSAVFTQLSDALIKHDLNPSLKGALASIITLVKFDMATNSPLLFLFYSVIAQVVNSEYFTPDAVGDLVKACQDKELNENTIVRWLQWHKKHSLSFFDTPEVKIEETATSHA